jgi:2-polyprenyl-3-methyl-5-hydroxy-6-metoxy-1,4-benzoquinol methylase
MRNRPQSEDNSEGVVDTGWAADLAVIEEYDEGYYEDYQGPGRKGDDVSTRPLLALLRRRVSEGRLLEVGCGYGYFLRDAELTYDTYGMDISSYAIQRAARVTPESTLAVVDVESARAVRGFVGKVRFEIIVALNVLEHLNSPFLVLENLHSLLVPGGYLFFKVPKGNALVRRWYSLWGREHEWQGLKDPTHVSLLPSEEWINFLDRIGFDYAELPTVPTAKLKRRFANSPRLHRFYFMPWLPFLKRINEGLTVLCQKVESST